VSAGTGAPAVMPPSSSSQTGRRAPTKTIGKRIANKKNRPFENKPSKKMALNPPKKIHQSTKTHMHWNKNMTEQLFFFLRNFVKILENGRNRVNRYGSVNIFNAREKKGDRIP